MRRSAKSQAYSTAPAMVAALHKQRSTKLAHSWRIAARKPHRSFINPLLQTTETGFRHGDTLDLAFHEVSNLLAQHHGEGFCGVESKLRQSVRRWMTAREVLASMAC